MSCAEKLEALFREHQVAYEVQEHHTAYTALEVAATEHVPGKLVAKAVMAFADEKLIMLVLPANRIVDYTKAEEALGIHEFRLASESDFAGVFPDCEVGAMPPFGNLYGVPVYVDRSLAEDEAITFAAGSHTRTMSIRYADYERLVSPHVVDCSRQRAVFSA